MKKSLVLAMAMALGVTASAYAANPFSDVPAGHWAYDSVAKLAAAGVVDGYADGAFDGDKLMTRYEMAQIVAKAMAKGANVDKLAAEFADELDTLGVRVAKLEKGADAVKITGNIRYSLKDSDGFAGNENRLRSRIYFKGAVNDDWTYTGMLENNQYFSSDNGTTSEEDTKFQRAYMEGKLGGLKVTAGRYSEYLVNGNLYDTRADGVKATYGDKVKLTGFYIKPTNQVKGFMDYTLPNGQNDTLSVEFDNAWGAKVDTKVGVVNVTAGYTVFGDGDYTYTQDTAATKPAKSSDAIDDNKVWNAGVAFNLAKELKFTADYLQSDWDSWTGKDGVKRGIDDEGIILALDYKGAKASAPGSWGLYGKWYDQGRGTVVAHTMNGEYGTTGFEGWMVGANYALAKNIVAAIEYYDLESKGIPGLVEKEDMETLWTQVVFTF